MYDLLLNLLAQSLGFVPKQELQEDIPDEVYTEAKQQSVLPLVFSMVPNAKYQNIRLKIINQNVRITRSHAELGKVLTVPFTTIKGYASSYYYSEPMLRVMGDVDFLVDDVATAEGELLEQGFVEDKVLLSDHHLHFTKQGMIYELHWQAGGVLTAAMQHLLDDTVATSRNVASPYGEIIIPDDFHHGLIMLLHMLHHMQQDSGMGLRHLCDWAVFVHHLGLRFADIFETMLQGVQLWRAAQVFSLLCVYALKMQYESWMGKADEAELEALLQDILHAGNMGCKDTVNRERAFANHSLIGMANAVTRNYWPLARRYSFILPLGWVYFGCRYFKQMLKGERQSIFEAKRKVKDRKKLYSVFELPEH